MKLQKAFPFVGYYGPPLSCAPVGGSAEKAGGEGGEGLWALPRAYWVLLKDPR